MFKVFRYQTPPASLEKRKSYTDEDVVKQLRADFFDKCYICESNVFTAPNVEHLVPKHLDKNLEYNWENLFLACSHCNSVKNNNKYDNKVLDCTKEDVVNCMSYNYSAVDRSVAITPMINDDEKVAMTAQLIEETFNMKNTALRSLSTDNLTRELDESISSFRNELIKYSKLQTKDKEAGKQRIIKLLSRVNEYSAFKKWIVLQNKDKLSEFLPYAQPEM